MIMSHYLTLLKYFVIGIVATILIQRTFAQDPESGINEPIKIQRIKSPVVLDGFSNEFAWEGIESFPLLMRTPNFGNEPSERTEILLSYDDDYLYVAGRLYDSEPSKIQSTSFKRDGGWNWATDHLGILIDTFNNNENAVVFTANPVGTRTELNILNDAEGTLGTYHNPSWNTFWDVVSERNDNGWFAEIRIPFSSLRFDGREGRTIMGLTVYRLTPRKSEMNISH
jgi:hypothetical protein